MKLEVLICVTALSCVFAEAPLEAKKNSYGIELKTTSLGTELNYLNPEIDVKGKVVKDLKVDSDDAKLVLAMITPKSGDVILFHNKMSVEGDLPKYSYSVKKRKPEYVGIHGTHDGKSRDTISAPSKLAKSVSSPEPPPDPDVPIELGVKKPEDENSEASGLSEEKNMNKMENYKADDPPPSDPDIPIELGSAIKENDDQDDLDNETTEGEDKVTYLPIRTPSQFVMMDDDNENGQGEDENAEQNTQHVVKRDISAKTSGDGTGYRSNFSTTIAHNTDGDFDGELLRDKNAKNVFESDNQKNIPALSRKRRSLASPHKQKNKPKRERKHKNKRKVKKLKSRVRWMLKNALIDKRSSKRSDIEADKALLKTIENLNIMATKRDITTEKKPMKKYMNNLAHDVRGVLSEAKLALKDTGRVIRGLRRVISGTSVLTKFTNNAVKFAKYFSMEPNNATIDYLEEKAIVSVLEAQRASNEAREAARLAKTAYAKAQAAEKRMEVASKGRNPKNMIQYLRTVGKQANRASKAARIASKYKNKSEKHIMIMDQELRKMGSQLAAENRLDAALNNVTAHKSFGERVQNLRSQYAFENEANDESNEETKSSSESKVSPEPKKLSSLSQISPDIQLLLPKAFMESERNLENRGKFSAKNDTKPNYADYFQMKQKQLEKQLGTVKNYTSESLRSETPDKKSPALNASLQKTGDLIPPSAIAELKPEVSKFDDRQPDDELELEYIASLNKKIARIKQQEEEATQRLRAVELARTFAATKAHSAEDLSPIDVSGIVRSQMGDVSPSEKFLKWRKIKLADLPESFTKDIASFQRSKLSQEPAKKAPSLMTSAIPDKYASLKSKVTTHETATSHTSYVAKKGLVHGKKKLNAHIFPGEYTGFKKQDIAGPPINRIEKARVYEDRRPSLLTTKSDISSPRNAVVTPKTEDSSPITAVRSNVPYKSGEISSKNEIITDVLSSPKSHFILSNSVAKSNIASNKASKNRYSEIEDALSEDENTVVAEDNDATRKREKIESEQKLATNLRDGDSDQGSNDESESGNESGDEDDEAVKMDVHASRKSNFAVVKKIDKGAVSVTVAVHHNKRSNSRRGKKLEDFIDPFGFNRVQHTNEGSITSRRYIPKPSDYDENEYRLSYNPKPLLFRENTKI